MSFLLDALRKSEDQKRRGSVPTIHGGQPPPGDRRRPAVVLYVLLILLPLLLVFAWYLTREPAVGEGLEAPAPGQAASAQSGNVGSDRGAGAGDEPGNEATLADSNAARESRSGPVLRNERTPVEQYDAPPAAEPVEASPETRAGGESGQRPASTLTAGANRASTPQPVSGESVRDRPVSGSTTRQATTGQDTLMPGMITFWELPGSVRNDIMDMHISVMVFAGNPQDRFILMNGKRWVEGDEPQSGLRIEEIRREGVVFTFRRYRFLVAP